MPHADFSPLATSFRVHPWAATVAGYAANHPRSIADKESWLPSQMIGVLRARKMVEKNNTFNFTECLHNAHGSSALECFWDRNLQPVSSRGEVIWTHVLVLTALFLIVTLMLCCVMRIIYLCCCCGCSCLSQRRNPDRKETARSSKRGVTLQHSVPRLIVHPPVLSSDEERGEVSKNRE